MSGPALRPSRQAAADTDRLLAESRKLVEPAHRAVVHELSPELRRVAGYHAGWWDADGRPSGKPGKAIRPALVLTCARAVAGEDSPPASEVIKAAVAVELIHDFSLLHDDVMDGDDVRRHRPSAWAAFGTSRAILTGDALVALALSRTAQGALACVLAGALLDLCQGQSADLAAETACSPDLEQCLNTAERKTGSLLGAACQLGALAAGANRVEADHYREFGVHLGVAFQLIDDILGIWGDPTRTGKPAHSDLATRKRSLPVVAALTADSTAARRLARIYFGRDGSDEPAACIVGLLEEAGGRAWAEAEADRRIRQAARHLHQARPHSVPAQDLHNLAHLITKRDH